MGMSVGNSGGSSGGRRGRRRNRGKHGMMSEINVTPMVDVMLVLLIIFMVSAPLLVNGVPLDLPETSAGAIQGETEPLTVSVTEDGRYAIKEEFFPREEIVNRLKAIGGTSKEGMQQRIIVRGATDANYGKVVDIIALIQQAGFKNIALASKAVSSGN